MKSTIVISLILLTACGFLMSPVGEELVVDGSTEVIKLEHEIFNPPKLVP